MGSRNPTEYEVFTTFINFPACSLVQELKYSERCSYVTNTLECIKKKFHVNYIQFLYCTMKPRTDVQQLLCAFTLLSLCLVMFIILATTSDRIFCPALKVMSKLFGLNEHLAGITLLAFGNGSPDLFTSLASMNNPSRMLFSDLFGAGIYVGCVVGGTICILAPFRLQPNNILRDCCFYIFAAVYIEYIINSKMYVTVLESVGVIMIYFCYLVTNFVDQYLLKRYIKYLETRVKNKKYATEANLRLLEDLHEEAGIDMRPLGSNASIDPEVTRQISHVEGNPDNTRLFQQFAESLNPFDKEDWKAGSFIIKTLVVFKVPINLILLFMLPVVNTDLNGHGWSKLLNSMQVVILPTTVAAILFPRIELFTLPMCFWIFLIFAPLSVLVFFTTRTDIPPSYHSFFAFLSVIGSITVIYSCASETVQIFYVLGIVTNCSNAFLGATLLAWGNSIGDLVANVSLSRAGYQKMGFAACYGGPLFNTLLAIGIQFLYKTLQSEDGTLTVNQGALGENCYVFLTLALCSTLVWSASTNFYARRSIGIFCYIFYVIFFLYAILGETEVIQTYAPDIPSGLP